METVYIPIGRETIQVLGRKMTRIAATGKAVLLGDWNMAPAALKKEFARWKIPAQMVQKKGSPQTRHGHSHRRASWTELDYFVLIGGTTARRAKVGRGHPWSDHWPLSMTVVSQ
ncbi:MAG: uncharacterized protein A8A55_3149 [Amphiamblys sp. WSBS2006]|nr:MAG: uncharacterized protein A8A55_3149 [Amphiamblys sp. WSBS2006]